MPELSRPAAAGCSEYRGFPFRIKWEGRYVAGAQRISLYQQTGGGPNAAVQTVSHWLSLEEGFSCDPAFIDWTGQDQQTATESCKRNELSVEVLEHGRITGCYYLRHCHVSRSLCRRLPAAPGSQPQALFARMLICHTGWERAGA